MPSVQLGSVQWGSVQWGSVQRGALEQRAPLRAQVVQAQPLYYSDGADPATDRPAHVRAGSGLAWLDGALYVAQDDAQFLAVIQGVDKALGTNKAAGSCFHVSALALPAIDGLRQFDVARGNKRKKRDWECLVALPATRQLLLLGSGSAAGRDHIAVVTPADGSVQTWQATDFYRQLGMCLPRPGCDLNLEGAGLVGDQLTLFHRGNGESVQGVAADLAPSAMVNVAWSALRHHLDAGGPLPPLGPVTRLDLGAVGDVPLCVTDATPFPPVDPTGWLILAAAEASPNAVDDGAVVGTRMGVLRDQESGGQESGGHLLLSEITEDSGAMLAKVEGVAVDPADPYRVWAVVDADDHTVATTLLELRLSGPWLG